MKKFAIAVVHENCIVKVVGYDSTDEEALSHACSYNTEAAEYGLRAVPIIPSPGVSPQLSSRPPERETPVF